jgi:hypothetical protein
MNLKSTKIMEMENVIDRLQLDNCT